MKTPRTKAPRSRDVEVLAYHAKSRAEVAALDAKGQGRQAFVENMARLGIDVNSGIRPRIVGCNGVRFRA